MRSQGVEDFHFRTRFPRTDEWRELRGWYGLSPRQNESGVRYIQQGISASKGQNSIVLRLIPLGFRKNWLDRNEYFRCGFI